MIEALVLCTGWSGCIDTALWHPWGVSAGIVHGNTIPSPRVLMIESSIPFSAAPILKLWPQSKGDDRGSGLASILYCNTLEGLVPALSIAILFHLPYTSLDGWVLYSFLCCSNPEVVTKILKNGYNMINDYDDNNYKCIYSCVATVN